MHYKVITTAYTHGSLGPLAYLGRVHRIVGSLATAELATKRNIETMQSLYPGATLITRKEVHS